MKQRALLLALTLSTVAGLSVLGLAWIDPAAGSSPPARIVEKAERFIAHIEVHEAGIPKVLHIPTLGIDAPVELVGQTPSGAMDVPQQWNNAGWYEPGTRPGEKGNAVVAGHLDSDTGRAVFWDLGKLKLGDSVEVHDDRGDVHTFVVEGMETYDDSTAPMEKIFGEGDEKRLNLVTCDGAWDDSTQKYSKRLVVYTVMRN